jgi:hypothetical protein
MSALLEGFRTGWGAMSQHNQQQENKRRYDQQYQRQLTQDEMNAALHNERLTAAQNANVIGANQVSRLDTNNQYTDTSRALGLQNQVAQTQVNTNQANRIDTLNTQQDTLFDLRSGNEQLSQQQTQNALNRQPAMFANEDKVNALNLSTAEMQNGEQKKTMLMRDLTMAQSTGDPEVMADFMVRNINDLQGTNLAGFSTVQGIESGITLGDSLNNGDLKSAAAAANTFFKPQLNKAIGGMGKNGKPITDVQIAGIQEAGEGFRIPITVTTQDGSYPSFISELRSSDPNDPPQYFSPQRLIGTVKSVHETAKMLYNSSYMQRLNENARNMAASQSTGIKGNFEIKSDPMGNPLYKVNKDTGAITPLSEQEKATVGQGIEGTLNASQLEDKNDADFERITYQREQQVEQSSNEIFGSLINEETGLDQSALQAVARKVANKQQDAIDSGSSFDLNGIIETELNNWVNAQISNQQNTQAINKQFRENPLTPGALY